MLSISSLPWDYSPNPSPRILNVASRPRNDVHMQMGNGLSCGCPIINSNVHRIRAHLCFDKFNCLIDGCTKPFALLDGKLRKALDMSLRDYQKMAFRHRVAIPTHEEVPLFTDNIPPGGEIITEQAPSYFLRFHSITPSIAPAMRSKILNAPTTSRWGRKL